MVLVAIGASVDVYASDTEEPSIELLEFIGDGIEIEDEIVDPLGIYDMQVELDTKSDEQKGSDDE